MLRQRRTDVEAVHQTMALSHSYKTRRLQTNTVTYLRGGLWWPQGTGVPQAGCPCCRLVPGCAGPWQQGQDAAIGHGLVTGELSVPKSTATGCRALGPGPSYPPTASTEYTFTAITAVLLVAGSNCLQRKWRRTCPCKF